jgi:hypothetical protein
LEKLQDFLNAVEENVRSEKEQEEEMGDIPEEFTGQFQCLLDTNSRATRSLTIFLPLIQQIH